MVMHPQDLCNNSSEHYRHFYYYRSKASSSRMTFDLSATVMTNHHPHFPGPFPAAAAHSSTASSMYNIISVPMNQQHAPTVPYLMTASHHHQYAAPEQLVFQQQQPPQQQYAFVIPQHVQQPVVPQQQLLVMSQTPSGSSVLVPQYQYLSSPQLQTNTAPPQQQQHQQQQHMVLPFSTSQLPALTSMPTVSMSRNILPPSYDQATVASPSQQRSSTTTQSTVDWLQYGLATTQPGTAVSSLRSPSILGTNGGGLAKKVTRGKDVHNLYVSSLPNHFSTKELVDLFSPYGPIASARFSAPRDSNGLDDDGKQGNLSRGYGFVCFRHAEHAAAAMASMIGAVVHGSPLQVRPSRKHSDGQRSPFVPVGSSPQQQRCETISAERGQSSESSDAGERGTEMR